MNHQLIRMKEVSQILGMAKSSIYLKIKKGEFPQGILIGDRARVWEVGTLNSWVEKCKSETSIYGGQ